MENFYKFFAILFAAVAQFVINLLCKEKNCNLIAKKQKNKMNFVLQVVVARHIRTLLRFQWHLLRGVSKIYYTATLRFPSDVKREIVNDRLFFPRDFPCCGSGRTKTRPQINSTNICVELPGISSRE